MLHLSFNHICNIRRLQICDLQFLHHLHCNINGSVCVYVKRKVYIPTRTCEDSRKVLLLLSTSIKAQVHLLKKNRCCCGKITRNLHLDNFKTRFFPKLNVKGNINTILVGNLHFEKDSIMFWI